MLISGVPYHIESLSNPRDFMAARTDIWFLATAAHMLDSIPSDPTFLASRAFA